MNTYYVEVGTMNGGQNRYKVNAVSIKEAAIKARRLHISKGRAIEGQRIAVSVPGTNEFKFFYC